VLGGIPVLFDSISMRDGAAVEETVARQVLSAFDLPDDPLSLLRLRTLMRKQVRFGGSLIQTESTQFLDRVRSSGHAINVCTGSPAIADAELPPGLTPDPTPDLAIVPRYTWSKNYMPRRMGAGTESLANMRLDNCGDVAMARDGAGRVMVALRWQHRDGTPAQARDIRTPLPIDLPSGRAVTIAVMIVPPTEPGSYLLTVTLVQEQVRWLDADSTSFVVSVETEVPGPVPDGWTVLPGRPENYGLDHERGRAMLRSWLAEHLPASRSRRPVVCEVGGNAVAMCAGLDVELVNVDVDLLGLQVGRMIAQQRSQDMVPLCADALNLPFPTGHFDAIVIFASLHHFPDPAALLNQVRRKLRPDGFIGLFCEPVGHVWPGAIERLFLAELEKGVNEQSFSLREYALMFRQADLEAAEVLVDFDSLKARLVHARPETPDRVA
jgi:SAM-dependent methyltransferase